MFEFCTPIIYGSPKVAAYHSKALGIKDNFTIINDASAAQDGKLNIIPAVDEEIKVELGIPSPDATLAAVKALDRAITDYKDGLFDVLVCAPADNGEPMWAASTFRVVPNTSSSASVRARKLRVCLSTVTCGWHS